MLGAQGTAVTAFEQACTDSGQGCLPMVPIIFKICPEIPYAGGHVSFIAGVKGACVISKVEKAFSGPGKELD